MNFFLCGCHADDALQRVRGRARQRRRRVAAVPAALVTMDFHAHLNSNEVGGLLGGSFDEATATLRCTHMESD